MVQVDLQAGGQLQQGTRRIMHGFNRGEIPSQNIPGKTECTLQIPILLQQNLTAQKSEFNPKYFL